METTTEQISPRVEKLLSYCKYVLKKVNQEAVSNDCASSINDVINQINDILVLNDKDDKDCEEIKNLMYNAIIMDYDSYDRFNFIKSEVERYGQTIYDQQQFLNALTLEEKKLIKPLLLMTSTDFYVLERDRDNYQKTAPKNNQFVFSI